MYTFDYLFLFGVHVVLLASTCRHLLQYWIIWMRSGLYRPTGLLFNVHIMSNTFSRLLNMLIDDTAHCYYFVAHTQRVTESHGGNRLFMLEDTETCTDVKRDYFQEGAHYLALGLEYTHETQLNIVGRNMSCGVFGAQCGAFPTTVIAQGRDLRSCVGAPLFGHAYKCPLVDMIFTTIGMQESSYRCPCNGHGTANCQKVVMYFGNGSVAVGHNAMDICDVIMTVQDDHIFDRTTRGKMLTTALRGGLLALEM